jgi:hypothetical protein
MADTVFSLADKLRKNKKMIEDAVMAADEAVGKPGASVKKYEAGLEQLKKEKEASKPAWPRFWR